MVTRTIDLEFVNTANNGQLDINTNVVEHVVTKWLSNDEKTPDYILFFDEKRDGVVLNALQQHIWPSGNLNPPHNVKFYIFGFNDDDDIGNHNKEYVGSKTNHGWDIATNGNNNFQNYIDNVQVLFDEKNLTCGQIVIFQIIDDANGNICKQFGYIGGSQNMFSTMLNMNHIVGKQTWKLMLHAINSDSDCKIVYNTKNDNVIRYEKEHLWHELAVLGLNESIFFAQTKYIPMLKETKNLKQNYEQQLSKYKANLMKANTLGIYIYKEQT